MCLHEIVTKKRQRELVSEYSSWIKIFKVVCASGIVWGINKPRLWTTGDRGFPLKYGINKPERPEKLIYASTLLSNLYLPLFHAFLEYSSAEVWERQNPAREEIITCFAKKQWVTRIGAQNQLQVVVVNALIAPKCPNVDFTEEELEEFGIK